MKDIKYIVGDATDPVGDGVKIIIHCCNDIGKWGKGFVVALSRKWPETRKRYVKWYRSNRNFKLGNLQYVKVADDTHVCNMIGQKGIRAVGKVPPIRYGAIAKCLEKVRDAASRLNATVHCPRFGAGLAGGSWEKIEGLLISILAENDIQVIVYDLPKGG